MTVRANPSTGIKKVVPLTPMESALVEALTAAVLRELAASEHPKKVA
jgi:hypothetical protein